MKTPIQTIALLSWSCMKVNSDTASSFPSMEVAPAIAHLGATEFSNSIHEAREWVLNK